MRTRTVKAKRKLWRPRHLEQTIDITGRIGSPHYYRVSYDKKWSFRHWTGSVWNYLDWIKGNVHTQEEMNMIRPREVQRRWS